MQLQTRLALAFGAIASVTAVHNVTFTNNCDTELTPTWSSGSDLRKGVLLAVGATAQYVIPETYFGATFYAQDGSCTEPGGAGCTSFHCTLPATNPNNECYLKVADGFNVPLRFQLNNGCVARRTCWDETCKEVDRIACRAHQFGIELTFCPPDRT
ncbi:hypothetical protein BDV98DRAFT_657418 [Pterulicium gracile]|uniref:Thaumatin n=1 Tax=Pterulicium gracile TaxID=1884261 RepID=A0A5C3QLQ4_9AGAR|nr:hypothetical protein BDV98DRAFT_657418 [Pterula gracilis]